ncbi:hypothetical protein EFR23_02455 [Lactobacillus delbrueckii subsp. lactis]|nr:hypothetical protein [Lactobacillus delbrueckii subsp. lactis]
MLKLWKVVTKRKNNDYIICNIYYGFTSDLTLGVIKMPWFTIMTVIVVILAVFGLIALAKYLINYSKKGR